MWCRLQRLVTTETETPRLRTFNPRCGTSGKCQGCRRNLPCFKIADLAPFLVGIEDIRRCVLMSTVGAPLATPPSCSPLSHAQDTLTVAFVCDSMPLAAQYTIPCAACSMGDERCFMGHFSGGSHCSAPFSMCCNPHAHAHANVIPLRKFGW